MVKIIDQQSGKSINSYDQIESYRKMTESPITEKPNSSNQTYFSITILLTLSLIALIISTANRKRKTHKKNKDELKVLIHDLKKSQLDQVYLSIKNEPIENWSTIFLYLENNKAEKLLSFFPSSIQNEISLNMQSFSKKNQNNTDNVNNHLIKLLKSI
jgi:hypothetical protein